MRRLLSLLFVLCLAWHAAGQIVSSPWTKATNAIQAREALGIYETNAAAYNVTNVFTNFNITAAVIGTGTNAVTFTPVGNTITVTGSTSGVKWDSYEFSARRFTLNGDTITAWPTGGGTNTVSTTNSTGTRYFVAFVTNDVTSFPLSIGRLTNGAAFYTLVNGTNGSTFSLEASTDDGTNWFSADTGFNSNAVFRFSVALAGLAGSPAISNLTVFSVENFSTLGATNDYTLQIFRVAEPSAPSDAAPQSYVDRIASTQADNWALRPAKGPVAMMRNELQLSGEWALKTAVTSNELRAVLQFGGVTIAEFSPGHVAVSNVTIYPVATNDVTITIGISTNQVPGPFRLLAATNVAGPWRFIAASNSWPTGPGGSSNYTLTVWRTNLPGREWYFYPGRSNAPAYRLPAATL